MSVRHSVVISDIHLSEVERGDGLWMRYRQEPYSPDRAISSMLDALLARVAGDELVLVLNGDIFDLDAPRVVDDESVFHDLPRNAEHAVPMMQAILRDHPVFVSAVARVLAAGHTVVFISGNHDVQLTLPEVRDVVRERLITATRALDASLDRGALEPRIVFRAWFHITTDGILIEHGNQYDSYCCYRYPMAPFAGDSQEIQPTMGSLATRNLISRMGYFNPHVDDSFMLSFFGYIVHWARYYLFSRRSLAFAWALGAGRTIVELVRRRDPESRARRRQNIALAARENGVHVRYVARHARLFARPAEDDLGAVMRELWVDRVLLIGATALFAGLWITFARGALVAGAAIAPALIFGYELLVPKPTLEQTWRRVGRYARRVAAVHRARAVVFGHTHHPEEAWENGVFIGNSGSWSAAYRDLECTTPLEEGRPVIWLKSGINGRPEISGGLMTWKDGAFEPRAS
jgi:UDP-2,3-diacylglucosamine pyrophosphatase LpxH